MNEEYRGDAPLQKKYTADFLAKKQVKNNGEIPQYYVEGDYPFQACYHSRPNRALPEGISAARLRQED